MRILDLGLGREHVLLDERADAAEQLLEVRGNGEVDDAVGDGGAHCRRSSRRVGMRDRREGESGAPSSTPTIAEFRITANASGSRPARSEPSAWPRRTIPSRYSRWLRCERAAMAESSGRRAAAAWSCQSSP